MRLNCLFQIIIKSKVLVKWRGKNFSNRLFSEKLMQYLSCVAGGCMLMSIHSCQSTGISLPDKYITFIRGI